MAPNAIPDRWLNYKPIGQRVQGTRFIAFKVPLREEVIKTVKDDMRLSCFSLLKRVPNIGMIIDLTNTNRYYDPYFFTNRGIKYEKLMIPGHEVPPAHLVQLFRKKVRDYLKENANNTTLIGVHCTHGVNRTGYLICNFMVSEMKIDPIEAMKTFETARGHLIERQNYRNDLLGTTPIARESRHTNWRNRSRSPHRSKGFISSIHPNREERNPFKRQRSDLRTDLRSDFSPRTSTELTKYRKEEGGNRRNPFRTRDPENWRKESSDYSSRSTENWKGNSQKNYRWTKNLLDSSKLS